MNYDDDQPPSEPPPTYEEAISDYTRKPERRPPPTPQRPQYNAPPMPTRPSSVPSINTSTSTSTSVNSSISTSTSTSTGTGTGTSTSTGNIDLTELYTTNPTLPFKFPRGFLCSKCKNSGYKTSNNKICRDCWDRFYLRGNAYNPNPRLAFQYPVNFLCDKCYNTGYKKKNRQSCQDCWERFSPRNQVAASYTPFNPLGGLLGGTYTNSYMGPSQGPWTAGPSLPPLRVPPGDPRLGGILCGRCRGSGLVHTFLLDEELCPVCNGLGRVIHGPHIPPPHGYGPPPHGHGPPHHGHGHGHGHGPPRHGRW
ncbi:uncharacterized protein RJT21DRAFT_45602 [Scheffersomyces amazonensis]|uniref:uncharacterized protein n=1 Tax=Scheffersomyces amazonensis TaxID=1078765 RepID=UPI00315D30C5